MSCFCRALIVSRSTGRRALIHNSIACPPPLSRQNKRCHKTITDTPGCPSLPSSGQQQQQQQRQRQQRRQQQQRRRQQQQQRQRQGHWRSCAAALTVMHAAGEASIVKTKGKVLNRHPLYCTTRFNTSVAAGGVEGGGGGTMRVNTFVVIVEVRFIGEQSMTRT